jgi:hypothetical protein
VITRAFGSPKIPRTVGCAQKPPTNTYPIAAGGVSMLVPSEIHAKYRSLQNAESTCNPRFFRAFKPKITHSIPRRPINFK